MLNPFTGKIASCIIGSSHTTNMCGQNRINHLSKFNAFAQTTNKFGSNIKNKGKK